MCSRCKYLIYYTSCLLDVVCFFFPLSLIHIMQLWKSKTNTNILTPVQSLSTALWLILIHLKLFIPKPIWQHPSMFISPPILRQETARWGCHLCIIRGFYSESARLDESWSPKGWRKRISLPRDSKWSIKFWIIVNNSSLTVN